jgi:hypothetical protein
MIDWRELGDSWRDDPAGIRESLRIGASEYTLLRTGEAHQEDSGAWWEGSPGLEYRFEWPAISAQWHSAVHMMELRTRTPVNLEDRLQRLEGAVLELSEALVTRPIACSTSIIDLNSSSYSLNRPIPVLVEEYRDEAVATFPEVEAHGWGTTPAEAINDLKAEVILLYEELTTAGPEELGKLPTAWARVLRYYVTKAEEVH